MTAVLAAVLALQIANPDPFLARVDLQALYDEMSEIMLSLETPADVDNLHAVLYASDYVYLDKKGEKHPLAAVREELIRTLQQPPYDWISQAIQKVSSTHDGARVVVEMTTVRSATDTEGQYGPQGRTHTLTEVTTFRDDWVKNREGAWRLKAREQVSAPKSTVDKPRFPLSENSTTPATQAADRSSGDDAASTGSAQASTSSNRILGVLPNYATVNPNQPAQTIKNAQVLRIAALDSFDPYIYPFVGFVAALSQAGNHEPSFGKTFTGYEKRYAAAFADNTIGNMMTTAVLPIALQQDPRYFILGRGSILRRTRYAASRSLITRRRSGGRQFNLSEVGGNAIASAIAMSYYPAANRSVSTVLTHWGMQVMWDTLANEMKEFWPDIRRKL
jgi:hypothetical protein